MDNETLSDLLSLVCITVNVEVIKAWTVDQKEKATAYARAVYLSASDNNVGRLPKKPDFLPEENE